MTQCFNTKELLVEVPLCFLTEVKKELEEGDEPRAETESESEEELSCFAPTVWTHTGKTQPALVSHRVDVCEQGMWCGEVSLGLHECRDGV